MSRAARRLAVQESLREPNWHANLLGGFEAASLATSAIVTGLLGRHERQ